MIVILFRSKLTAAAGKDYDAMSERMLDLARSAPGFVEMRSYKAEDGERLTVVRWKDHETLKAWREDLRHREAQEKGRERWYEYYAMEIAEVVRESRFVRPGT
jgi:heme-degrading monooxygenase HmoA